MHALDIPGRRAIVCIHVPATDPLCAGRHADLVTLSVITDHRSGGVRAVSLVVARERRIVSANVTDTVMNGIVPVVIVIGILSVPPTVMRLQSVMGPAHASVCAGDDNLLPCEPLRPYLWRMCVIDAWFNRFGLLKA